MSLLALAALVTLVAEPGAGPLHLRAGEHATVRAAADGEVRWFVARPIAGDYDDVAAVAYQRVPLPALDGRTTIDVAEVELLARPGTHRLGASVGEPPSLDPHTVAGLLEVVVRRDDSYLGYLTELLGVPFVLYPRRAGGVHPTDARLGADCVALVIYGRRRMGARVGYVAPAALVRWLVPVGRARAGDVLHFGFQTAVLYEDRPPRGRVTGDDVVIQTFHGVAELARLGDLPYGRGRPRVLRWR